MHLFGDTYIEECAEQVFLLTFASNLRKIIRRKICDTHIEESVDLDILVSQVLYSHLHQICQK